MNWLFVIYLHFGIIVPQGENNGRLTYAMYDNGFIIEYAYKEEIMNYIKTGEFYYDEDLK